MSEENKCKLKIAETNKGPVYCGDKLLGLKRYCLKHSWKMSRDFRKAIEEAGLIGFKFEELKNE